MIHYCLDWTEQAHHLAGGLGAALTERLFELDWLRRASTHRSVRLTETGRIGLADTLGVTTQDDLPARSHMPPSRVGRRRLG